MMERGLDRAAAALLPALTALERVHDGPLPPQAWSVLRQGSAAIWRQSCLSEAAALQQGRAWALLASAGRWRRRGLAAQAESNLAAAREALRDWRRLSHALRERAAGGN
jgi:hypothetical protein